MKDNPRIKMMNDLREEMYRDPEKALRSEDAAKAVNYSYRWFTICWNMQFGVSYHEDLQKARAKHIKAMLKRWKTIPDIAEELDVSTDTIKRIFRNVYGMSIKKFMASEVGLV